jgi:hypothetical protein
MESSKKKGAGTVQAILDKAYEMDSSDFLFRIETILHLN